MSTTGTRSIVVGKINVLLASLGLLFVASNLLAHCPPARCLCR